MSLRSVRLATTSSHDRPNSSSPSRDDGFTLIELLIVIGIMPLLIGAITVATIAVLTQQPTVASRISNSEDALIVSGNYVRDVQSASMITTSTGTVACGAGGKQLLGLQVTNVTGATTSTTYVSYVELTLGSGSNTKYALDRRSCAGSQAATPVLAQVAASLPAPGSQGTATVTCAPTVSCTASSGWMAAAGISSVSLAVAAPSSDGGYLYSLNAVPLAWTPTSGGAPGGGAPITPFMLLNSSPCSQMPAGGWFNISGTGSIVSGSGNAPIADASTCANSIQLTNPSATVSASVLYSADCPALQSVSPPPPSTVTEVCEPLSNPLSALQLPTSANPTAAPAGACTTVGTTVTCPAGEYATTPAFANTATVTFAGAAGSVYIFDQLVTIHNSQQVTFGPGTYWFKGGITMTGATQTVFGTGTYLLGVPSMQYNASDLSVTNGAVLSSGAGGVLCYMEGGSANFSGGTGSTILGEGSNFGVAIWDAAPNTGGVSSVTISNGASATAAYGGIYVPQGRTIISGNGNVSVPFVISDLGQIAGSGSLVVG
jgi:prepilin-type N-terminal cleavage/methylation domain-containing protein